MAARSFASAKPTAATSPTTKEARGDPETPILIKGYTINLIRVPINLQFTV